MSKTFGQALDIFLYSNLKSGQSINSVYMYLENYDDPKVILNIGESSYDYTEIIFTTVSLKDEIEAYKAEIQALKNKKRALEESKRKIENAISLLRKEWL